MRLGIDLGGTKIEIIALDNDGETLLRKRIKTPQGDYKGTLQAIIDLIEYTEKHTGQKGSVGIGTPGSISPMTGFMRNSNSTCLNGKPFVQDLQNQLQREIRISNDANCFALSEAVDGVAKGASVVFGVIIGTGVGGGIVINQQPLMGVNAIAGEWGHNPLPWATQDEQQGYDCYCGQQGCIETFLSGTGLERHYQKETGQQHSAKEVVEMSEQGNAICSQLLSDYEERLAKALAHVINILDPDVIVLGGGMSNVNRLYENVPKKWEKYVFSDVVMTRLVAAKYGDSSGVRGAAWLW